MKCGWRQSFTIFDILSKNVQTRETRNVDTGGTTATCTIVTSIVIPAHCYNYTHRLAVGRMTKRIGTLDGIDFLPHLLLLGGVG